MKKRIIPIIALALIAVIAITTIIFAICSANYKPNFPTTNSIILDGTEVNGGNMIYLNANQDDETKNQVDKINQLFNASFSESALNSLFNGRLGYQAELIKKDNAITNVDELAKYVAFVYENEEDLPKVTYDKTEISYNKVIVQIGELDTANLQIVKIYLCQVDSASSSYYFQTYGNFYEFFKYLNALI